VFVFHVATNVKEHNMPPKFFFFDLNVANWMGSFKLGQGSNYAKMMKLIIFMKINREGKNPKSEGK
jgi:hypothetical protein